MSNLLDKASIVTTPTAYDNGKILSVKPVQSLGSEKIVNGDFATNLNNWVAYSNTLISWESEGYALLNSDNNYWCKIKQSNVFEIGKTYKVILTAKSNRTDLNFHNSPITGSFSQADTFETFDQYYTATTTDFLFGYANAGSSTITIDNVSVKEVLDGDFQFTRNSSATRVSSQGLIEDVQILSSNLVSNGDFSQEGSEEVTNGDFSNGVNNWAQGSEVSSFTVTNGIATIQGNASSFNTRISQSISVTIGKTYKITGEIKSNDAGDYRVRLFNGSYLDITNGNNSEFQTFTYYHNATTSTAILYLSSYYSNGSADFSIDNVSVKEVGQDWEFSNDGGSFGWRIANERAICDAGGVNNGRNLNSSTTLVNGKTYKLTLDILQSVDGMNIIVGSTTLPNELPTGTNLAYEYYIDASQHSGGLFSIYGGSSDLQEIDNISVIEITDDTNLPRIDYTGGEGHWLFEPQSTNLLTYSEDFDQWSMVEVSTDKNYTSPDGTLNAVKITDNSVNSTHRVLLLTTTASSGNFTYSVFLKKGTMTDAVLNVYSNGTKAVATIDLENGTIAASGGGVNAKIEDYGNDWYRCSIGGTLASTSTTVYLYLSDSKTPYVGNGDFLYVYGAQLEQGTYATSYIPTNGGISTRLADAAFGAGSSDLINSTEGVLYAEIAALADDLTNRVISLSDGTTGMVVDLEYNNSTNRVRCFIKSGGSFYATLDKVVSNEKDFHKIAYKYKSGETKLFVDGLLIATSTDTFSITGLDVLNFSRGIPADNPFYGKVKCVAVFKEALTDAELTCLTTI